MKTEKLKFASGGAGSVRSSEIDLSRAISLVPAYSAFLRWFGKAVCPLRLASTDVSCTSPNSRVSQLVVAVGGQSGLGIDMGGQFPDALGVTRLFQTDLLRLLLYLVTIVVVAVLVMPWLRQGGMFIAEVVPEKSRSAWISWMAIKFGELTPAGYLKLALTLTAGLLFFPLVMCLNLGSGKYEPHGPWGVKLYRWRTDTSERSPALKMKYPHGGHFATGFVLMAGIVLLMFWLLLKMGWTDFIDPLPGAGQLGMQVLFFVSVTLLGAIVIEWLFRGALLSLLLRALPPFVAVVAGAAIFACVLMPFSNISIAEAESWKAGYYVLRASAANLIEHDSVWMTWIAYFAIGSLLGYARFRTSSLLLSIGLLSGGWAAVVSMRHLTAGMNPRFSELSFIVDESFIGGMIPLCMISAALLLVHVFSNTLTEEDEDEPEQVGE